MRALAAMVLSYGLSAIGAPPAQTAPPAAARPTPAAEKPQPDAWLNDLAEGRRQSRLRNKPLLVLGVMKECPYCREFDGTLATPAVAARLEKFVLCRFDIEADLDAASDLDVTGAPTVVLLLPNGMRVYRHEGAAKPADFLGWLDEADRKVAAMGPDMLQRAPKELVPLLAAQDPVLREAATLALTTQAEGGLRAPVAAVAEAFAQGNLATRLGALELLRLWGAPLGEADPWKPATIPPAIAGLRAWAKTADVAKSARKPSPAEIEQDLQLWTNGADNATTRAAYERLARAGADLLPRVRERIPPTWDARRERLTALRYRLLMPVTLAAALPQAPFQMAARDADLRAQALDAVSRAVRIEGGGPALQGFFLEAFSDPDSKVREAALRGLRETGAGLAKENVLKLLADPSPNVRAGILNDLARSPLPEMADDLAKYAAAEKDEDLVVHAVRALREIRNKPVALNALAALARHPSWRVRAESVEALGSVSSSHRGLTTLGPSSGPLIAKTLGEALKDEDAFVVGKAIEVIAGSHGEVDASGSLDALLGVVDRHPALALAALQAVAENESLKRKAVAPIKKLCKHARPEVRAAALQTLAVCTDAPVADEVLAGLADPESAVRASAAGSICACLRTAAAASTIPENTRKEFIAALRKLASADDAKERFAALTSLAVLGDADFAFPGIEEMVAKDPGFGAEAAQIVRLLGWEQRKKLFELLRQQPLKDEDWGALFAGTFTKAPESAEESLWEVFSNDPHTVVCPDSVLQTVLEFYGIRGGLWYTYPDENVSAGARARLEARARAQLGAPHARRRIMGLILLCRVKRAEGLAEAKALYGAPDSGAAGQAEIRRAAGELLLNGAGDEAEDIALAALSSADGEWRKSGMRFLASKYGIPRYGAAVNVGERPVYVQFLARADQGYYPAVKRAWEPPALPAKLTAGVLRPFLEADDPDLRAGAAYLLAIRGDGAGLGNLIEAWRGGSDDPESALMLARAIAALGDDRNSRYVREMYETIPEEQKSDFGVRLYWAIRRVKGPEIERLRRTMRKELGASLMN